MFVPRRNLELKICTKSIYVVRITRTGVWFHCKVYGVLIAKRIIGILINSYTRAYFA